MKWSVAAAFFKRYSTKSFSQIFKKFLRLIIVPKSLF